MAGDGGAEHLGGVIERPKLQQVVSPVEQVLLGKPRGALIGLSRCSEIARALSTSPSRFWSSAVSFAAIIRPTCARLVQFPRLESERRSRSRSRPVDRVGTFQVRQPRAACPAAGKTMRVDARVEGADRAGRLQ
jgi:hypothetical protein